MVSEEKSNYGVFVYLKENGENLNEANEYYIEKDEAINNAKQMLDVYDEADVYVEVWEKPDSGLWGESGEPVWESDKIEGNNDTKEEDMMDWSFDLSDISANKWEAILKLLDVNTIPKQGDASWIWEGDEVEISTTNNPITGEYSRKNRRENEKDYVGAVGITGEKEVVETFVSLFKKYATFIKGESPHTRDII